MQQIASSDSSAKDNTKFSLFEHNVVADSSTKLNTTCSQMMPDNEVTLLRGKSLFPMII